MKKLLLIGLSFLLMIVGCDRYEFLSSTTWFDKWTGNAYRKQTVCEKVDISTMPISLKKEIDEWRIRNNALWKISDKGVYRFHKKEFYNVWDEYDNRNCQKKWVKQ